MAHPATSNKRERLHQQLLQPVADVPPPKQTRQTKVELVPRKPPPVVVVRVLRKRQLRQRQKPLGLKRNLNPPPNPLKRPPRAHVRLKQLLKLKNKLVPKGDYQHFTYQSLPESAKETCGPEAHAYITAFTGPTAEETAKATSASPKAEHYS